MKRKIESEGKRDREGKIDIYKVREREKYIYREENIGREIDREKERWTEREKERWTEREKETVRVLKRERERATENRQRKEKREREDDRESMNEKERVILMRYVYNFIRPQHFANNTGCLKKGIFMKG